MDRCTRSISKFRNSSNYLENVQHQIWKNHVCSGKDFSTSVPERMGPFVKWVSNHFEQYSTDFSEIDPEIGFLIKDGNATLSK